MVCIEQSRETAQGILASRFEHGETMNQSKTGASHRVSLESQINAIRTGGGKMEALAAFYEDRSGIIAPLMLAARAQSNQKPKTMMIQVEGKLTDESLVALYQTSRGWPAATFTIIDLSAVMGSAVSCDFVRRLANQKTAIVGADTVLFIVAPQPYVYGLCRMFQTLREGKSPLLVIVHGLDEALAAMGIEPPHFEPFVIRA